MGDTYPETTVVIGIKLREARLAIGYSQAEVSAKLGIGRPRYSDLENGKRDISLKQLRAFSVFFSRPLEYFLNEKESAGNNGFEVLFRKSEGNNEVKKIVIEFENLCDRMALLENLAGVERQKSVLNDYGYDKNRLRYSGRFIAEQERSRLNLGQMPLKDLDRILEEKSGLNIFYLDMSESAKISGIFSYDENRGGSMLINAGHTAGRQLFSLAHEYGHFVFHKSRFGMISLENEKDAYDERIADIFADELLMPAGSVEEMFYNSVQNRSGIMAEDVVYLLDYYGVSYQAMVYRLNNLRLISDNKKEELLNIESVSAVRSSMGLTEPAKRRPKYPSRYYHLCFKAYTQEKITTAKMAELLEIPLYKAMEIGDAMRRVQ